MHRISLALCIFPCSFSMRHCRESQFVKGWLQGSRRYEDGRCPQADSSPCRRTRSQLHAASPSLSSRAGGQWDAMIAPGCLVYRVFVGPPCSARIQPVSVLPHIAHSFIYSERAAPRKGRSVRSQSPEGTENYRSYKTRSRHALIVLLGRPSARRPASVLYSSRMVASSAPYRHARTCDASV